MTISCSPLVDLLKISRPFSCYNLWTSLWQKYLQLPVSQPRLRVQALSRTWSSLLPNGCTTITLTPCFTPPPQQSQTSDLDLSSAVQGRSYRYNQPNDVKDLSAKLMNDKNSLPPFTLLPPLSQPKTPPLQAKKIKSQDTLLISSPCIFTLTFLNRSLGYKGHSSSFCVLKCGKKLSGRLREGIELDIATNAASSRWVLQTTKGKEFCLVGKLTAWFRWPADVSAFPPSAWVVCAKDQWDGG